MSQPLRIENPKEVNLITSRTENSRLWFVNNAELEHDILGGLAKYQATRNAILYAFVIQGNHPHIVSNHPGSNRADFMRDFNSRVAWLAKHHIPELERGKFWERRYASQAVPTNDDIEEYFFYCALQPVLSGLVEKISDYPGYNSFHDAVTGITRTYTVVNWSAYNNAKRFNPQISIADYTETYELRYARLPGYEHLSQHEYKVLMYKKLEERRQEIVRKRRAEGKGFLGREALLRTKRGSKPFQTKRSTRNSKRPLVLTRCGESKKKYLEIYFDTFSRYKIASEKFLKGRLSTVFPTGTYPPPGRVTLPLPIVH